MRHSKTQLRLLSYVLTAIMLLSLVIVPTQRAMAEEPSEYLALEKLSDAVYEAYKNKEEQDVIVVMKKHADLDGAITTMEQRMEAPLTVYERNAVVVNELKADAYATQAPIVRYLDEYQAEGLVDTYETFFIINAIHVKADHEVIQRLMMDSRVEKIYENGQIYGVEPIIEPSTDPQPAPKDIEWNIKYVYADRVWDEFDVTGEGVTIGIIDSGVNAMHPALKTKFKGYNPETDSYQDDLSDYWFDAVDRDNKQPTDDPQMPHGSHCMGTILGSEGLKNRIGVAPDAKFIAARALSSMGGSDTNLLAAAEWMLQPNGNPRNAPRAINNSWGGKASTDEWFLEVLNNWRAAGILPVFAAGNRGLFDPPPWPGSISNPANLLDAFAVGAIDINGHIGDFSFLGPSLFDPTGKVIKPEISAPGVNIRSSVMGENYEGGWNGTSMAAPHITGTAALMLQINPNLTVNEMEEILTKTAMPLVDEQFPVTPNMGYGYGCVNAYDACADVIGLGVGHIKGKLLEAGEDNEAPTMKLHHPTAIYQGQELPLTVETHDNVGITSVELQYKTLADKEWTTVELTLDEGTKKDGLYHYTIPANMITVPEIQIRVTIDDFGNLKDSQMISLPVHLGIVPDAFAENFENPIYGWTLERTWDRGMPEDSLEPAAYEGKYVLGTNVGENWLEPHPGLTPPPEQEPPHDPDDGGYIDPGLPKQEGDYIAEMPPLDLSHNAGDTVNLEFAYYLKKAANAHAYVEYSNDRENWSVLSEFDDTVTEWEIGTVDLSALGGMEEPVYIRFNLSVDGGTTRGWYIDDLKLQTVKTDGANVVKPMTVPETRIDTNPDVDSILLQFPDNTLPVDGIIRILETGRSVTTDSLGDYSMTHAVNYKEGNNWTLRAEAYGYRPEERVITIEKDVTQDQTFVLEPLQRSTIEVTAVDAETGDPVQDVVLRLLDEPNAGVYMTDANGKATFTEVYEGSYILRAFKQGYFVVDVEQTVYATGNNAVTVKLKATGGEEFKMEYFDQYFNDDQFWEEAYAWNTPGLGFALRFKVEEPALLKHTTMFFSNKNLAAKGTETSIGVLIKDAKGNYVPAAEPRVVNVEPNAWNTFNLEDFNIRLQAGDEFMIYTLQLHDRLGSPAMGFIWQGEEGYNNTFAYAKDGSLASLREAQDIWQTPMIRAFLLRNVAEDSSVAAPVITSHEYLNYTTEAKAEVEGTVEQDGTVTIVQGTEEFTVESANGKFAKELNLQYGENRIAAKVAVNGETSELSKTHNIILDNIAPKLTVDAGETLTVEEAVYELTGAVEDDYLDTVLVDGKEVSVMDGKFNQRVELEPGENVIKVKAIDKAGNETEKTITIVYNPQEEYEVPSVQIERIAGGTRYSSAVEYSKQVFETCDTVILANGTKQADAVLAGPLSVALNAPILLTKENEVPRATLEEMDRLGVKNVILIGGNLVISEALENQLKVNYSVERLAGGSRVTTSLAVAEKIAETAPFDSAVLVNKDAFIDAITIGPATAKMGQGVAPILMVEKDSLPGKIDEYLQGKEIKNVVLIGGKLVLTEAFETALGEAYTTERIAGATRYKTATAIVGKYFPEYNQLALVNAKEPVDALCATLFLSKNNCPVLLTETEELHETVKPMLNKLLERVVILGGELAVSKGVELELYQLLK